MRKAFYSKCDRAQLHFFNKFIVESGCKVAIYLHPKNRISQDPEGCTVYAVPYEDLTKTQQWLRVNNLIGPQTALLLQNPSRYPKITSQKVQAIQRLEKQLTFKAIADIVPFTMDVQYLYTPLSYLGRDILGYPHYYAFRENYHERGVDGIVRSAHDFNVLAPKVASVAEIDYSGFLVSDRTVVEHECSSKEQQRYDEKREALFAADNFSPQKAVTALADLAHSFKSRQDCLLSILSECKGRTIIYCNLASYAKRAEVAAHKAGFTEAIATSYQLGAEGDFDNCIYLESPIVKGYLQLDAESNLRESARVFHIVGNAKVDRYLFSQSQHEMTQIDKFTQELARVKAAKNISTEKCIRSGSRANQMALF